MSTQRQIIRMKVANIIDHTSCIRELILETIDQGHFVFRAGQFVMLHVPGFEKPVLRAYSLASSEKHEMGFHLIFKFVANGIASTFVWGLKAGAILEFTGPFGRLFFTEPPTEQIIFLNTGAGLSQHFSYLLSLKEEFKKLKYTMFMGLNNESEIYYLDQLEELKKQLPFFNYHLVLSSPNKNWTEKIGFVQAHLHEVDFKSISTSFYLCGNGNMIKETKKLLIEGHNFDKTKIYSEAFD